MLFMLGCLYAGMVLPAERIRIYVSGAEQEQMARDIARQVARTADIELDIRITAGSPEAVLRLNETGNLQLALLQSDVVDAYRRAASRGNPDARGLIEPLRTLLPLHDEEIHFVVRHDSAMQSFQDLAQARINLGPLRSSSALTAANLYRLMFDAAIPDAQASFLPNEDALLKLITEQSLDAVAIIGPRPVKLLANMKPEARQFVKLLKFDVSHSNASAILGVYQSANASAAHYPNLIEAEQPILTVKLLLASSGMGKRGDAFLTRFAAAWCKNLDRLKTAEPSRWESVNLVLPDPATGWIYARSFAQEVRSCQTNEKAPSVPCGLEDRSLGLCE